MRTIAERLGRDFREARRKRDRSQAVAVLEAAFAHLDDAVGHMKFAQISATVEHRISETVQTVRQGEGGNRSAAERLVTDVMHFLQGDFGELRTIVVFTSDYVSTTCALNGRKVAM